MEALKSEKLSIIDTFEKMFNELSDDVLKLDKKGESLLYKVTNIQSASEKSLL